VQVIPSTCRATVGQVSGGGRTEKPMLKAGRAYHKYRVKRNSWPKVHAYFSLHIVCCAWHVNILTAPATTDQDAVIQLCLGTAMHEGHMHLYLSWSDGSNVHFTITKDTVCIGRHHSVVDCVPLCLCEDVELDVRFCLVGSWCGYEPCRAPSRWW